MACVFCQNHQISQEGLGTVTLPADLALKMIELQDAGCTNVEPVSPSPHLPGLLQALAMAMHKGLRLPVVYNTNGYEAPETLDVLEGIVDVYVPDLKYSQAGLAARYSDAPDYVAVARAAILTMHSQVGNLVVDLYGAAVRGLILRHLVLPGNLSGTRDTLLWISDHLPHTVTLSLMAQYVPLHRGKNFPPLDRKITVAEYEEAVDLAWDMGFENVFVQDLDSPCSGIPDFGASRPFSWE
jgi:putative pyruvate formate lyase activating enzyme